MKPLGDYSHIKGFNYTASYAKNDYEFWSDYRHDVVEREMGYAQRIGFNSARLFTPHRCYVENRERFLANLRDFVQTAWAHGISSSPIVYFGREFYPDFQPDEGEAAAGLTDMLRPENYPLSCAYFDDLYEAVGQEPGLIFWDVSNEPGYHTPNFVTFHEQEPAFRREMDPVPEDMEAFREKQESVWRFLHHVIAHMREKDPVNAIGIGNTYAYEIEPSGTAPLVDILIYHDYFETRKRVRDVCDMMKALGEKYGKPVINNETGCLCRANPYDMELEILQEYGFGYYLFELMVGQDMWSQVHGLVYPDGTIRDPSAIAAVLGFFRNRGPSRIPTLVNREGSANRAIALATRAIAEAGSGLYCERQKEKTEGLLEAAEYIANLLEAGEHVPMHSLPTARIAGYRRQETPDREEIIGWLYELVRTLQKACRITGESGTEKRV
ncbi:MAG: hypothetical protein Q4C60_00470 [Eubacteriales bacterium]|nr:hypothetical protein [Eubacteriales bacterium]